MHSSASLRSASESSDVTSQKQPLMEAERNSQKRVSGKGESVPVSTYGEIDVEASGGVQRTLSAKESPMTLEEVCYDVETKMGPKRLIHKVSGEIRPGQFLAIMGSSGAGKSTLLNLISRRYIPTSGEIAYEYTSMKNVKSLSQKIAYVMQDDVLPDSLTCREALYFSALLRLRDTTKEDKIKRVNEMLAELGLMKCADTIIKGGKSGGLSGGERKRLAMAIELIHNPPVLLLDEPTSGLDSFAALSVVNSMKRLAKNGRTVVATIHQPSSEIMSVFDQLLMLAEGNVVYWGQANEVPDYLSNLGYTVPIYTSPVDYFMRVMRNNPEDEEVSLSVSKGHVQDFIEAYKASAQKVYTKTYTVHRSGGKDDNHLGYAADPFTQFYYLSWRSILMFVRQPQLSTLRLVQSTFTALLTGLIYFNLDYSTAGIRSRLGAFFFLLTGQTFGPMFAVVNTFQEEITLLTRERRNGMYRLSTYFMAKVLTELPQALIFPLTIAPIVTYMMGLQHSPQVIATFGLVIFLQTTVAQGLGLAISAAAPSVTVALVIAPIVLLPFLMFGGLFTDPNAIPVYFEWLNAISFFRFSFNSMIINEFQGVEFPACHHPGCYPNPQALFKQNDINANDLWYNILILVAYVIVLRLLAFIALMIRTTPRRS